MASFSLLRADSAHAMAMAKTALTVTRSNGTWMQVEAQANKIAACYRVIAARVRRASGGKRWQAVASLVQAQPKLGCARDVRRI